MKNSSVLCSASVQTQKYLSSMTETVRRFRPCSTPACKGHVLQHETFNFTPYCLSHNLERIGRYLDHRTLQRRNTFISGWGLKIAKTKLRAHACSVIEDPVVWRRTFCQTVRNLHRENVVHRSSVARIVRGNLEQQYKCLFLLRYYPSLVKTLCMKRRLTGIWHQCTQPLNL